jgi:hypothetical protein
VEIAREARGLGFESHGVQIFLASQTLREKMHMYRAVGAVSTGWPVLNERSFSTGPSARY